MKRIVYYRQVQQMKVPAVSSVESWKRKKTKSLHKLKDRTRGFLHFITLWGKTLQKIGG